MRTLHLILLSLLVFYIALAEAEAQGVDDFYSGVPMSRTADGAFVLGDPSAGIKLIEFADFLCTSCQNYQTRD